jgi:hypothetical protein
MERPAPAVPDAEHPAPVHRHDADGAGEVTVAALEIVMVAAAVLLLITLSLYLWQRLGLIGGDHAHRSPPHKHLDIPPHEHDE